jgi:hypothetical protein
MYNIVFDIPILLNIIYSVGSYSKSYSNLDMYGLFSIIILLKFSNAIKTIYPIKIIVMKPPIKDFYFSS